MIKIRVEAECRPTEDIDKVKKAILNIFNPDEMLVEDLGQGYRLVVAYSYSIRGLVKLYEKLRIERILDAARSYLLRHVEDNVLVFKLNKQVAFAGRISFVDADVESPLGPITFTVESNDLKSLIDWLTPPTDATGRPIFEHPPPEN